MLWGMVAGKGRLLPGLLGFTGRCWDTEYAFGGGSRLNNSVPSTHEPRCSAL